MCRVDGEPGNFLGELAEGFPVRRVPVEVLGIRQLAANAVLDCLAEFGACQEGADRVPQRGQPRAVGEPGDGGAIPLPLPVALALSLPLPGSASLACA